MTVTLTKRSKKSRVMWLGVVACGIALTATACLGDTADKLAEPFRDAPRSGVADYGPMDVIGNADGFSNVGTKCDGYGNRIYVLYKGDNFYGAGWPVPNALMSDRDPCKTDFHNSRVAPVPAPTKEGTN
jgi:hypothetical protein